MLAIVGPTDLNALDVILVYDSSRSGHILTTMPGLVQTQSQREYDGEEMYANV